MLATEAFKAPENWDERRRAKALLRRCRRFHLEESARRQALCLFGRQVENLNLWQVAKLEQTFHGII